MKSEVKKKVFVSGCYDMLHSGHVAFFEEAASYGDLYVGIGSDKTIQELKARKTINTEAERLYMVKSLKAVKDAWVNSGSGLLDFEKEVRELKPDIFFVNSDGSTPLKEKFCEELGIEYIVSKRVPHGNLPIRSTTALRQECNIPYRVDLAGGWLDQPNISQFFPGPVLTICVEPDYEFNDRSGMATSSRKKAIELWQTNIPTGDTEKLSKTLFCFENPPGKQYVSGSQDSIGIVTPGLNKLDYNGDFWPEKITNNCDKDILDWIEEHICLIPLYPRKNDYDVYENASINQKNARNLSIAAEKCWNAILNKDLNKFGEAVTESFNAQLNLFPNMAPGDVLAQIMRFSQNPDVKGWKISGAGGGGYLILVCEKHLKESMSIRIRRA